MQESEFMPEILEQTVESITESDCKLALLKLATKIPSRRMNPIPTIEEVIENYELLKAAFEMPLLTSDGDDDEEHEETNPSEDKRCLP